VGARRVLAERLAELAAELEREREAYAGLAVLRERRRIARELHDVVAHALSLIVIQSAAGRLLLDEDPAAARESLGAIREAAGQAAQDTERLHALLDERTPRGLAQLPALLGHAAASGLRVTLDAPPAPAVAPQAQDAAYRLVQEALTNVAKHAPGADVHIRAAVAQDGLEVEVANGPARRPRGALHAAGAGQGLPGMRERVLAAGGHLSAGPEPGGGWTVRARLAAGVPAAPALTPAGSAR
jgi:signal transduction histidine kinase